MSAWNCVCRIIEDYDRMIRIILLTTISCTISCPSFLPQFSIQCEKYSRQELWKHWLGAILWMQVIACYDLAWFSWTVLNYNIILYNGRWQTGQGSSSQQRGSRQRQSQTATWKSSIGNVTKSIRLSLKDSMFFSKSDAQMEQTLCEDSIHK